MWYVEVESMICLYGIKRFHNSKHTYIHIISLYGIKNFHNSKHTCIHDFPMWYKKFPISKIQTYIHT